MSDFYTILGVDKTASADEIKRAYRKLASQHHPDKGGDTEKFKEIEEAYRTLGDADKRTQYDNPSPFGTRPGGGWQQAGPNFNFNDIFEMFGARVNPHQQQQRATVRIQLWISIEDVAQGGPRTVALSTHAGSTAVEINIPKGVEDGDLVRYPLVGPGRTDVLATFRIKPDVRWERHGADIITDQVIMIWDLVLGTTITLTTVSNSTVEVTVPPGTQPGTVLRLRSHGLPHKGSSQMGDMLVRVQTRLPANISDDLREQIRLDHKQ